MISSGTYRQKVPTTLPPFALWSCNSLMRSPWISESTKSKYFIPSGRFSCVR